jgi:hypothetical protein
MTADPHPGRANTRSVPLSGVRCTGTDQTTFLRNLPGSTGALVNQITPALTDTHTGVTNEITQQTTATTT